MNLSHDWQPVAVRSERGAQLQWKVHYEERLRIEAALAIGDAERVFARTGIAGAPWELRVRLKAGVVLGEPAPEPVAVPRLVAAEPRYGRAVPRVYREPARATSGRTVVPYEPARWLE